MSRRRRVRLDWPSWPPRPAASPHSPSRARSPARPERPTDEGFEGMPQELRPVRLADGAGILIAVVDYGVKTNILRSLRERGCRVVVLPHAASWAHVEATGAARLGPAHGTGGPAVLD